MKPEFRPIPITILDFLGALLPGLVWLLLLTATADLVTTGSASLSTTWTLLSSRLKESGPWAGPLAAIGGALLIGYTLKPGCMRAAQLLSRYFFKLDPAARDLPSREMVFPFTVAFKGSSYVEKVSELVGDVMGISIEGDVPGKFPFSAAKRYLKLIAPSLWEESERMEAEVRMTGALFLAAIYNLGLTLIVLGSDAVQRSLQWSLAGWCWLGGSGVVVVIVGIGFNRLRLHEVEYTYMNLLLAEGHRSRHKRANESSDRSGEDR